MFLGRPVAQALEVLPLLFSVCGSAQAAAGALAAEQALGIAPQAAQREARRLLLLMEAAREHLFQILAGWSHWLGEPPSAAAMAELGKLRVGWERALYPEGGAFDLGGGTLRPDNGALEQLGQILATLVEESVLGLGLDEWRRIDEPDALVGWATQRQTLAARLLHWCWANGCAELGRCGVAPLGSLADQAIEECLAAGRGSELTARPTWQGGVRETGALARESRRPLIRRLRGRYGNGLLPRLAARVSELARLPARIGRGIRCVTAHDGEAPTIKGAGRLSGIGQVEAARGRLIHRVEFCGGVVVDYQIVAPTEWNFHPDGVLCQGLLGLPVSDRLPRLARLMVDAIDPCVGYDLQVA